MPATITAGATVLISNGSWALAACPEQQQQGLVKAALTLQPAWHQMAPAANGLASATAEVVQNVCSSNGTRSAVALLLEQGAPCIGILESMMQQELSDLAANEHQLNLIRQLLQQQQQHGVAPARTPAGDKAGSRRNHRQPQQQQPIRVMPLLGLTLAQLVTHLQAQLKQQQRQSGQGDPCLDASLQLLLQPGNNPLTSALGGSSGSPFLNALHSELQRIRCLFSSCYALMEEDVAAIGQHLPPAVDSSSSAQAGDLGAAGGKEKGKKKKRTSNSSSNGAVQDRQSIEAVATALAADSTQPAEATPAAAVYGLHVDLEQLQQRAAAVSCSLVQLDDFVTSSTAQLARLALQYDTLLTAAATNISSSDSHSTAAVAANGMSKSSSVFGLLTKRHSSFKQDGQQQQQQQQQQQNSSRQDVEFLLMTPGVCSHSSVHQQAKYTAGVPPDVYHQAVHKLITTSSSSEAVLWGLSVVYARLQHAAAAAQAAAAADCTAAAGAEASEWTAPDKFTRSTTKYWVHPSHTMRLKLALLQHLPLLIYGGADPVHRGDISSRAALRAGSGGVTSLVSSVYFDSPALDVYHTRLAREDGARLLRLRYYGPRQTGPAGQNQAVFVERKTHRESWTGERSVKERASLSQGQVPAFLANQPPSQLPGSDIGKTKSQLLQQVQEFLTAWQQAPSVRTEYLRTAWQRYDSNIVRLSLDEHMLLLRERGQPLQPSDWCADLESPVQLSGSDAVRFPYGILEIKLQEAAPAWVKELKASGVLVPVNRFSKFLHGMALLYPEQCTRSPSWFVWDEAAGCAAPASIDEVRQINVERAAAKQEEAAAWAAAKAAAGVSAGAASAQAESSALAGSGELQTPSSEPAQAVSGPSGPQPGASLSGLMLSGPSLAPLKIPRFPDGADMLPTAAAAAAAAGLACSNIGNSNPFTPDHHHPLLSRAALADYAALQHDVPHPRDRLLSGAGLHTPLSGSAAASESGLGLGSSSGGGGGGGRPFFGGGSGPFNAGINSACTGLKNSQSDTSSASSSSSYRAAQEAAARRSTFSVDGAVVPGTAGAGAGGGSGLAAHHMRLDSESFSMDQPLLSLNGQHTQQAVMLSGTAAATSAVSDTQVSSVAGKSPSGSSAGGIKRLMGCIMGGRSNRNSNSSDGAQEAAVVVASRRNSEGSTLQVINPLEVLCGHSSPHSNRLSSCSTSSQDTVTTGSGIGVNLDCSRSCGSPRGGPHAAMPAAGAGGLHVPASQGRSLDGSMAAATGTAAPVGGATPHNSQNGSSNNMWEMSTVSTMDSQAARAWAVQPAATAAAAAAPAGPKDAMLLPTIKDSTLLLPDMQQLVVQQMSLSAQQQMVVPPQQQQQHSIQVHYAMHDTNTVAAAAAVTAATTAAAVAATTAASGGVVKLAAVSSNTVKQLQELLPSVAATHAAVDTGAAAKQNDRDYVGSSSSSGSGGGGRKGRAVRLFSRLRLMSRGFSGRMGSRSSLRSSASATNEHLLGFTGAGGPPTPLKPLVRTRVEPKTFFANERTFLSWLHVSVLVMMTGLGLLGGSTLIAGGNSGAGHGATAVTCSDSLICSAARISGAIITAVSIMFMVYALYIFKKRTRQILGRSTLRYDDQKGPVILTTLLVAVTLVSLVLTIQSFRRNGIMV